MAVNPKFCPNECRISVSSSNFPSFHLPESKLLTRAAWCFTRGNKEEEKNSNEKSYQNVNPFKFFIFCFFRFLSLGISVKAKILRPKLTCPKFSAKHSKKLAKFWRSPKSRDTLKFFDPHTFVSLRLSYEKFCSCIASQGTLMKIFDPHTFVQATSLGEFF